jgi:ABC-type sugar transport system substrate-binding protein
MKATLSPVFLRTIFSLAVVGLMFTAVPTLAQNKHYRVGLVVGEVGNPFHTRVWKSAKGAAEQNNIDLIILDTKRDLPTESSNIDQLIAQHVDLIMVMPTSAEGTVAGLERILEANIPLITMLDSANGSGTKYRYVGSDFENWGKMQIDKLAELLHNKGDIVYIRGTPGFLIEHLRDNFIKGALKDHPDIHVVFEQHGNWNKPSGVSIMEDALARLPAPHSIQAVVAQNDNMVLGAIEALKRADRLSDVVTSGNDGNADALQSIVAGELTFTTFQNGEAIGKTAIMTALDELNGKNPPMLISIPLVLIDNKELAQQYLKSVYGEP